MALQDVENRGFMESMMTLMEKVDKLLKQRGSNQADLARALGVAPSRVTNWIQGTGVPNAYQTLVLARMLGVSMEYLADQEQEGPPPDASWHQDVERFVERVGIDELYMRLYGVRDLNMVPRVNPGDTAEVIVTRKGGKSPGNPRRSGNG